MYSCGSRRPCQTVCGVPPRIFNNTENTPRTLQMLRKNKKDADSRESWGLTNVSLTPAAPQARMVPSTPASLKAATSARWKPRSSGNSARLLHTCLNISCASPETRACVVFSRFSSYHSGAPNCPPSVFPLWSWSLAPLAGKFSSLCAGRSASTSTAFDCLFYSAPGANERGLINPHSFFGCASGVSCSPRWQRRLLAYPSTTFALYTYRWHSSSIFSSPVPTETFVKNVKRAPESLCSMVKWYLEKLGAGSSSLQCFLPSEICDQGKADLQQLQQQHDEPGNRDNPPPHKSGDDYSVHRSSVHRTSVCGSLPHQTSSSKSCASLNEERTGLKNSTSDDLPAAVDDSSKVNSSPRSEPHSDSDTGFQRKNVACASEGSPPPAVNRGICSATEQSHGGGEVNTERQQHMRAASTNQRRNFYEGWIQAKLCFGSSPSKTLRDAFRRTYDERLLRWGRLLELLDCFAGDIAYHYCTPHEDGYSTMNTLMVTASIQRMEFIENGKEITWHTSNSSSSNTDCSGSHASFQDSSGYPDAASETISRPGQVLADLNVEEDLWMVGQVTQSGSSSMGILIEVHQGGFVKGSVFFVMVAVDRKGRPAKIVPQLDVSSCSADLRELIHRCSAEFKARKVLAAKILSLVPPDPEETLFLHETWKKATAGGSHVVWMADTRLQSIELIQPEALTRYNRAFGGLVARKALELSYLTAQCFLRALKPCLRGVDDMFFLEPLYVGDMLLMVATVLWSTPEEIQIQVEAFREDAVSGGRQRTNLFTFRYDTAVRENNVSRSCITPRVYPRDYKECISYLEARRRYLMRREGRYRPEEKV